MTWTYSLILSHFPSPPPHPPTNLALTLSLSLQRVGLLISPRHHLRIRFAIYFRILIWFWMVENCTDQLYFQVIDWLKRKFLKLSKIRFLCCLKFYFKRRATWYSNFTLCLAHQINWWVSGLASSQVQVSSFFCVCFWVASCRTKRRSKASRTVLMPLVFVSLHDSIQALESLKFMDNETD